MEIAQSAYANIWLFICMGNFIMDRQMSSLQKMISSFKIDATWIIYDRLCILTTERFNTFSAG